MREESPNGGEERRLASGERMAVAHLSIGENAAERGQLRPLSTFIAGVERERGGRPRSRTSVRRHRRLACPAAPWRIGFPFPGSLTSGSLSTFEPVVQVGKVFRPHCSWPDLLTIAFPFSHTKTNLEIIKIALLLLQNLLNISI
jgi:hypothetical protein